MSTFFSWLLQCQIIMKTFCLCIFLRLSFASLSLILVQFHVTVRFVCQNIPRKTSFTEDDWLKVTNTLVVRRSFRFCIKPKACVLERDVESAHNLCTCNVWHCWSESLSNYGWRTLEVLNDSINTFCSQNLLQDYVSLFIRPWHQISRKTA